jgi:hypothetical protein
MLLSFPQTFRLRQAAALFVVSFPILLLLGFWQHWAWWLLILEIAIYLLALFAAGIQNAVIKKDFALILGVPIAIGIMHFAWGSGFIWSLITSWSPKNR